MGWVLQMLVCSGVAGTFVTAVSSLLSVFWKLKVKRETQDCVVYLEVYWGGWPCDVTCRYPRDIAGDQRPVGSGGGGVDGHSNPLVVMFRLPDIKLCFLVYKVFKVLNRFFFVIKKIVRFFCTFPLMTKKIKSS